jgi:hypothetical protein
MRPTTLLIHGASPSRARAGCRAGQAMVEFAVIVGLMSAMLVGVIDLPRIFYYDVISSAAALEGARAAAAGLPDADVVATARNSAPASVGSALQVATSPPAAQRTIAATPVWTTVTVQHTFEPLSPMMRAVLGNDYTITRSVSHHLRTGCALANGTPC